MHAHNILKMPMNNDYIIMILLIEMLFFELIEKYILSILINHDPLLWEIIFSKLDIKQKRINEFL